MESLSKINVLSDTKYSDPEKSMIPNHCCPIKVTKKEAIKMASQLKS